MDPSDFQSKCFGRNLVICIQLDGLPISSMAWSGVPCSFLRGYLDRSANIDVMSNIWWFDQGWMVNKFEMTSRYEFTCLWYFDLQGPPKSIPDSFLVTCSITCRMHSPWNRICHQPLWDVFSFLGRGSLHQFAVVWTCHGTWGPWWWNLCYSASFQRRLQQNRVLWVKLLICKARTIF